MPRRATQQVSLFPFLAVLVCTMGALILLLLVTTRQIRSGQEKRLAESSALAQTSRIAATSPPAAARAISEFSTQPREEPVVPAQEATSLAPGPPLPDLAELRRQIAECDARLQKIRDDQRQNAEFASTAEEEFRDSETTQAQLVAEQQLLEKQQRDLARQLAAAEIQNENTLKARANMQLAVEQTASLVTQLRQQLDEAAGQVAQSESFRRLKIELRSDDGMAEEPVLVECGGQALRLVAENIALTERDLTGYPTADNPLIAAVRTIMHDRRLGLDDAYVLLLVRPEGSLSFYAAQKLLRGTGIRFGYELIDDDQALQVEPAAAATVAACEEAIRQSIERRDVLYARLGAALDSTGNRVVLTESGTLVVEPPAGSQMPNVAKVDQFRSGRFYGGSGEDSGRATAANERPRIATSSALKDSHRMAGEAVGGFLRELGSARTRQRQDSAQERSLGGQSGANDRRDLASQNDELRIRPRDNTFQTFDPARGDSATVSSDGSRSQSAVFPPTTESPFPLDDGFGGAGQPMDPARVASSNGDPSSELSSDGRRLNPSETVTGTQPPAGRNSPALSADSFPGFASSGSGTADGEGGGRGTDTAGQAGASPSTGSSASSDATVAGNAAAGNSAAGISPADELAGAIDPGDRLAAMDQAAIERFLRLARAKQKMLARQQEGGTQPVTVFVDTNWLTIEEQDSLRIVNLDDETLHTEFVRGIVDEVTDESGGTALPALPLVRFVVSPGASVTHHRLQRLLDVVALPHASTISMQPYAIDAPQSRVAASSFGTAAGEHPE